jgi:hypothetical protein
MLSLARRIAYSSDPRKRRPRRPGRNFAAFGDPQKKRTRAFLEQIL